MRQKRRLSSSSRHRLSWLDIPRLEATTAGAGCRRPYSAVCPHPQPPPLECVVWAAPCAKAAGCGVCTGVRVHTGIRTTHAHAGSYRGTPSPATPRPGLSRRLSAHLTGLRRSRDIGTTSPYISLVRHRTAPFAARPCPHPPKPKLGVGMLTGGGPWVQVRPLTAQT